MTAISEANCKTKYPRRITNNITTSGEYLGSTPNPTSAEAAGRAIADAGLEPGDIDGLLTGVPVGDTGMLYPASVVEYLGLKTRYLDVVDIGGASGCLAAALLSEAGAPLPVEILISLAGAAVSLILLRRYYKTLALPDLPLTQPAGSV